MNQIELNKPNQKSNLANKFKKYDNSNSVKEYLKAFDNTKCYANGINVL